RSSPGPSTSPRSSRCCGRCSRRLGRRCSHGAERMLSVRELVRDLELELLAGDDAADAPVRWVHISELADPTPWLSGGELLLTTGMGLRDDAGARAYVERLADHGLAGLGFGLGFDHDEVPDALLAAARSRGFPVFAVPYELPFLAVTERAFAQLV